MNYTVEEIENLCVLLKSPNIDAQIVRNYIAEVLHLDFKTLEELFGELELYRMGIDLLCEALWIFDGYEYYEYYEYYEDYSIPYKCSITEQMNYDYAHLEYMQNYYPKYVDDSHLASWHQILPTLKHKRLWIEDGLSFDIMIVEPDSEIFYSTFISI